MKGKNTMSKAIGRIYGVGTRSPYGYETDYMKYLQGYNPYDYEQTLRNMSQSYENMEGNPEYNYVPPEMINQGIQYAQNNVANTTTDANYTQPVDYSLYGDDFSKEFIDQMLNDEEFQKILNEYIIPNEGGYNNDPADTGGETNMGIAQKYHPNEDIKGMTRERANAIYYRDYYNWNGLNKLPYPIRGFVVDYGLPTYPQNALKTVHNILGIPKSATIIGPTTLGIFENYTDEDYNDFLEKYRDEMNKYFNEIAQRNPQKQKFLRGWLNRANRAHLAR